MEFDFSKKTAFISGSSRGIGLSIAKKLHEYGCNIIINSRNKKDLNNISKKFNERIYIIDADVTKEKGLVKIRNFFNKNKINLDLLICNYGNGSSDLENIFDKNEWKKVFDINFFSSINTLCEFAKDLKKNKGNCLFISSICGVASLGAPVPYSVSKSAINFAVKNLANNLGKHGVRINALSPGNILHPGSIWQKKLKANKPEVMKMINKNVPLQKFGTPEDISAAAIFLLSDYASFITGSNLVIDGGQLRVIEV